MLIFSSHVLWLDEKYFPFITRQQPSLLLSWQSTSFMLQENNGARESKRDHASIQIYSKMYLWLGWYVFPLSFLSSGLFLVLRILDGQLLWISLTSIHEFLRHSSVFLITHRCCSNGDDSSNYFSCSYVIFYRRTKNQKKTHSFKSVFRSSSIVNTVIVFMRFFKRTSAKRVRYLHLQKIVLVTNPKFLGVWTDISDYGFMCMILQ